MSKLDDLPIWTADYSKPAQRPMRSANGRVCPMIVIPVPYSEVCMHMRVAGKKMKAELLFSEQGYPSVQLYTMDDKPFSSPILPGEAGFYSGNEGYYAYHAVVQPSEYERVLRIKFEKWIREQADNAETEARRMRDCVNEHAAAGHIEAIPSLLMEHQRQRARLRLLEELQILLQTGVEE